MKKIYLYPLIFIALLLAPHVALADSIFSVSDSDISKTQVMDYLFGSLTGKGTSVFGSVIGVFNGAVLTIGGVYVAYIYIAGTAQGAHDGQFLGKRWSSMWVPIRMLIGAVLAFPSLSGGFCLAQWIVVWLALQGIGFANHVWTAYAGDMLGAPAMANMNNHVRPYVAARQLFLNNLCVNAMNQQLGGDKSLGAEQNALIKQVYRDTKVAAVTDFSTNGGASVRIRYSMNGYGVKSKAINDECGSAEFKTLEKGKELTKNADGTTTSEQDNESFFGDIHTKTIYVNNTQASTDLTEAAAGINQAQRTAFLAAQEATKVLADAYIADPSIDVKGPLEKMASLWNTAMDVAFKAQASKLAATNKSFQDSVKADGWIMAGSYFIKISKMQQTLSEAMDNFPKVYAPDDMSKSSTYATDSSGGWFTPSSKQTDAGEAGYQLIRAVQATYLVAATKSQTDAIRNSPFTQGDIGNGSKSKEGFGEFLSKIFGSQDVNPDDIFNVAEMSTGSNPLTVSSSIGNKLISWGGYVLTVGLLAGFLNGGIATFAITVWGMLFLPGAVLTTVIPMMPFMIWIGSVLSWIVLLIECVIAAPLWAVAHMSPEGDGMTGGAKNGYSFILALTLRPVLMVFGLIGAIVAMKCIGALINGSFGLAFGSVSSGSASMTKLVGVIAGSFIYALMMVLTAKKVFELIHIIPAGIMKWMGGADSGVKEHGGEFGMAAGTAAVMANQAIGHIGQGVGGAVATTGKAGRGALGKGLDKLKDKKKKDGEGDGPAGGPSGAPGGGGGEGMGLSQNLPTSGGGNGIRDVMASNPKPLSEEAQAQVADLEGQRNDYLNRAREESPDYGRRYQEALNADRQSKATGVKGNQAKTLIGDETRMAKQAKKDGEPLEKYQETLLKANAKYKQARSIKEGHA